MRPYRCMPLLFIALLCLSGCAAFSGDPAPIDRYRPMLRLGVSFATDRLLTAQPKLTPTIVQVSTILIDVVDRNEFTSVQELETVLLARIPWPTIPAEFHQPVRILISAIAEELRVIIVQYQIPPTANLVLIHDVFTWVKEIALRHSVAPVRLPAKG